MRSRKEKKGLLEERRTAGRVERLGGLKQITTPNAGEILTQKKRNTDWKTRTAENFGKKSQLET